MLGVGARAICDLVGFFSAFVMILDVMVGIVDGISHLYSMNAIGSTVLEKRKSLQRPFSTIV